MKYWIGLRFPLHPGSFHDNNLEELCTIHTCSTISLMLGEACDQNLSAIGYKHLNLTSTKGDKPENEGVTPTHKQIHPTRSFKFKCKYNTGRAHKSWQVLLFCVSL